MKNKFFLIILCVSAPLLSNSSYTPSAGTAQSGNNVFIFTLNLGECVPCLNNAYTITDFIIGRQVPKQKIIFVIKETRKVVEKNYEESLKQIFDSNKISIVWNDKLYSQLQIDKLKRETVSKLNVFDLSTNSFVFTNPTQTLTAAMLTSFVR